MTIHQPAKDEFEKFNLCFIMGYGGIPTYFGPTGEPAYSFFGSIARARRPATPHKRVDNPRDMFDMLNVRERARARGDEAREPERAPRRLARDSRRRKAWRAEFFRNDNPIFQQMYSGRRAIGTAPAARGRPAPGRRGGHPAARAAPVALLEGEAARPRWARRSCSSRRRSSASCSWLVFGGADRGGAVLVPRRAAGAVEEERHEPDARRPTCSTRCSRRPTTRRRCSSSS